MLKTVVILMLAVTSAQAGLSKLEALSMIETADRDWVVGKAGERSRYQIMPRVWKSYTTSREYRNPELARTVAQRHVTWLEDTFRKATGRQATDFDLYVLWNGGPTYYARINYDAKRVHPVIRERAERYVNLRHMKQDIMPQPMFAMR